MNPDQLAKRLRQELAAKGWNQSDLVRASGIDKNTVSGVVNGKQNASDRTLEKIERALELKSGTLAASWGDDGLSAQTVDYAQAPSRVELVANKSLLNDATRYRELLQRGVMRLAGGAFPEDIELVSRPNASEDEANERMIYIGLKAKYAPSTESAAQRLARGDYTLAARQGTPTGLADPFHGAGEGDQTYGL